MVNRSMPARPSDQPETKAQAAAQFLPSIESKSRTAAVLDALVHMIAAADLKIGDRIPPETLLGEQLGVGRSTIREALNRWEGLGLVKRRRGSGTYLTANIRPSRGLVPTTTKLEAEGLLRILEVRRTLEIEAVRRAAQYASTDQKIQMRKHFTRMVNLEATGTRWVVADRAFHGAIYDACGNLIFGRLIQDLDAAFHAAKFSNSPFDLPDFGRQSVKLHEPLCKAIEVGDQDTAVAAILDILSHVEGEVRQLSGAD